MSDNSNSIPLESYITERVNGGYCTMDGYDGKINLHMFHEDLSNHILTWQNYEGEEFKFNVTYNNCAPKTTKEREKLTHTITDNLPAYLNRHNSHHAHTEYLTNFVREIANSMFAFGEVFYEVKCERNKKGSIVKLGLIPVYPPSMRCFLGVYFQVIPKKVAQECQVKPGVRYVPKNQILHIKPPKQLGGKWSLRHIIKRIALLDDKSHKITDLSFKSGFNNRYRIDVKKSHLLEYLEIARITRKYGWNQREEIRGEHNTLEYYEIYRSLIIAKTRAYFRDTIVKRFNELLNNDYLHTGIEFHIVGLNNIDDVDALIDELAKNSKKSFTNIWKRGFDQTKNGPEK